MKETLKAAMIILQNSTYGTMGKGCDEELKQETLEEAAKRTYQKGLQDDIDLSFYDGVRLGSKWQSERMYSEEEQLNLLNKYNEYLFTFIDKDVVGIGVEEEDVIKWFEQFKKK
jgi:hypothetical protein